MSTLHVNSEPESVYDRWDAKKTEKKDNKASDRVIQEVMYDLAPSHNLKKQTELHEKIRNDEDYDDWDYGTEPTYGKSTSIVI